MAELVPNPAHAVVEGLDATMSIPGLEGPAGLPLVTDELVRRGWPEPDIRKVLGENWLRVFRAALGVSG
jgi:membrane dipeptidase